MTVLFQQLHERIECLEKALHACKEMINYHHEKTGSYHVKETATWMEAASLIQNRINSLEQEQEGTTR